MSTDTAAPGAAAVCPRWRRAAAFSILYLLVAWVGYGVLPGLRLGSVLAATALAVGLLVLFLVAALGLILSVIALRLGPAVEVAGTLAGAGLVLGFKRLGLPAVGDYFIVVSASLFGSLVARLIRERNLLLPVTVVAGAVDIWGVYWGFVAHVAKTAPKVLEHFSSSVPTVQGVNLPIAPLAAMGIGDFLFAALYLAAVWRLGMATRRTAWGVFIAVLLSPLAFVIVPLFTHHDLQALPGLPFIGAGVIVANWRQFSLSREEKFALVWATVAAAGVIGVYLAVRHFAGAAG